ncbi:MAG: UDP-N-acetylmuramate dehydrogenase [Puniceicoccales bacterium]|nr:UDP-N-acetylmuramate dehydrogenase [Puniceicoccales bacterium]
MPTSIGHDVPIPAGMPAAASSKTDKAMPHVHLLGVCGMGVGPLAIYMRGEGWRVSGWDDARGSPMEPFLRAAGIELRREPDWGVPPDVVGFSSAVKAGHPVRVAAESAGVRLLRRGELLAEQMGRKKLVMVCGSHGKTTTSAMLAQALDGAGMPTGYVLGALYRDPALPPARAVPESPWVVAEVDESDGTINHFAPEITVAVNLDWDHPDYYRTEADLEAVFAALFRRTRGAVFIPAASERLRRVAAAAAVDPILVEDGPGGFNAANERMALAVARHLAGHLGTPPLGRFSGMRRRQDVLFENTTLRVMADYAHHPTEIAALLSQLRHDDPGRRLHAIFQPHRHSRTRQYAGEFAAALSAADAVALLPVYSAGEAPVEGGSTASVLAAAAGDPRFGFYEDQAALRNALAPLLAAARIPLPAPATLVFAGAGDIGNMAAAFARELRRRATCLENFPLGQRTTIGAGGACAWFAEPADIHALRELLDDSRADALPVLVVGHGSNLLVPDEGFDGLVIRLANPAWCGIRALEAGLSLECGAGAPLREIAHRAADAGITGFEFLEGIPGTLGGALRMNAGANGASVFDRARDVTWIDADGNLRERSQGGELGPAYRDCAALREGGIAISAVLRGTGHAPPEAIREEMRALGQRRLATQPRERSAGSVFKNPPGGHAGRLVESLGLKGLRIGGAEVSTTHANFIVNKGGATAADVRALVRRIRAAVFDATGIRLEPEIHLAGKSWDPPFPPA